jgi:hypothetical protein
MLRTVSRISIVDTVTGKVAANIESGMQGRRTRGGLHARWEACVFDRWLLTPGDGDAIDQLLKFSWNP